MLHVLDNIFVCAIFYDSAVLYYIFKTIIDTHSKHVIRIKTYTHFMMIKNETELNKIYEENV